VKTGKSAAAAWMLYLLMVIMLFLFLAPFGIVFFNSLKPLNEILLEACRTSCTLRISPRHGLS